MRQENAAVEAQLSAVTWSRLENDEIDGPRLSTLMKIADVLEVSLDSLIGGKNSATKAKI